MAERDDVNEHPHAHGSRQTPGGLNVEVITVVGITSVLLVIVAVYATQAWYYRFEQAYRAAAVYQQQPADVERYRLHEERRLNELRFRDPEQELIAVPIEQAMELYLEQRLESAP